MNRGTSFLYDLTIFQRGMVCWGSLFGRRATVLLTGLLVEGLQALFQSIVESPPNRFGRLTVDARPESLLRTPLPKRRISCNPGPRRGGSGPVFRMAVVRAEPTRTDTSRRSERLPSGLSEALLKSLRSSVESVINEAASADMGFALDAQCQGIRRGLWAVLPERVEESWTTTCQHRRPRGFLFAQRLPKSP